MSGRQLRVLTVPVMAVVASVVVATSAAGQTATPTTPWGDPDLQGIWGSSGATPMERPDTYQGRETLSDEEVAQLRQESAERDEQLLNRPAQRTEAGGNVGAYNNLWMERGLRSNRTSMLVDPPEGRFPPLTAAGRSPGPVGTVETTRGRTAISGSGVSPAAGCRTPCSPAPTTTTCRCFSRPGGS